MNIISTTQSQRADLAYIRPIYVLDWEIEGVTLHISDQDWRYKYLSSQVLYESYLLSVTGVGEVISSDVNPVNSNVLVEIANQPWSVYSKLSKLNSIKPFRGSTLYLYEIRRFFSSETFSSDIRSDCLVGIYSVEQLAEYDDKSLKIRCSSRIYNKRNSGFDKIVRSTYPYCAPSDDGKWRNVGYGSIENVPCRCIKTGAIDLVAAYVTATQTTITVQGLARFAFEAGGTIQVGTEVIPYTTFTAATNTFSGCIRTSGVSHVVDDPVIQLVSSYAYEALKHPARSITAVSVDDYDVTAQSDLASGTDINVYTGQSGDEHITYTARAIVSFPNDITQPYRKIINKTKDLHTHTVSSGTRYYPTTYQDGTSCANIRDWNYQTYDYNWAAPSYGRSIINFHDSSYVENTYAVEYNTLSFHVLLDKQTTTQYLVGDFNFYWIDRDPVTSTLLQRLTLSQIKLLTIPAGTYLGDAQWFHVTLDRPIRWRTGGIHVTWNSYDNYMRVQEMYIEASAPRGRIPVSATGGSGTVGNLYDGDESTYLSLTQATASTRAITMTPTVVGDRNSIKRLEVNALMDSNGLPLTWYVYAAYIEGGVAKVLNGTIFPGTTLQKGWYKFYFDCDSSDYFSKFMLSADGSVQLGISGGSGTTTVRIYEAYWNFEFESTVSSYELTKAITADSIRAGLHSAQLVIGDEVTVDMECRADDASGTITGTAGALITRPDHVLRHILVNLLGFSSSQIGSSFISSSSEFISRSFTFNFLANDISNDWQKVLSALANQCNCRFWEWSGKFELGWIPLSPPVSDCIIEGEDIVFPSLPKFSEKPIWESPNLLFCYYGRDYRTAKRTDDEFYRKIDPDSASKGFKSPRLTSSFGNADQQGELTLSAVTDQDMAQDLLDFKIARNQSQTVILRLTLTWRGRKITPSNFPELDNDLVGTLTYIITEYKLFLEKGVVEISLESV